MIVAASVFVWHYRLPMLDRAKVLRAQYLCLTYTAPADQVVYEQDKDRGDKLAAADARYIQQYCPASDLYRTTWPLEGTFRMIDAREYLRRALPNHLPRTVMVNGMTFPRSGSRIATIFLHGRRTPGGEQRLVVIEHSVYGLEIEVIRPGNLWRPPKIIGYKSAWDVVNVLRISHLFNDEKHLGSQIYAGQPDPNDESRFTIDACSFGVKFRLLGQLLPNDMVRIEVPNVDQIIHQITRVYSQQQ
jgi:hypothetical protein